MKTINKLVSAFFLFIAFMGNAQKTIVIDDPTVQGVGPGVPSPIDMYVYVLGAVAILFIAFYTKKYKSQKI